MDKKRIYTIAVLILLVIPLIPIACSSAQQTPTTDLPDPSPTINSQDEKVSDYASLVEKLRAAGANVEPAGEVEQPFFSVKGNVVRLNGNDVQVFEYIDANAAEKEASTISPDGSSIGGSMPFWVGPPHFFKAEKLIVLYIGEDEYTIGMLTSVLGSQFAGGAPYIPEEGTPLANEVLIKGLAFNPANLEISVGNTVAWYNVDSVTHSVTARDNSFDSGNLPPGEDVGIFQYTFDKPGEIEYYCKLHPYMVGIITIK